MRKGPVHRMMLIGPRRREGREELQLPNDSAMLSISFLVYADSQRSLCVTWTDRKAFLADLKMVYKAQTREEAETNLLILSEKWEKKYPAAIHSWENNWAELSTYFDFPYELRRIIYTTNIIEGYNRQLCKVTKNKSVFPTSKSVRKLLYMVHSNIEKKWTMPIPLHRRRPHQRTI